MKPLVCGTVLTLFLAAGCRDEHRPVTRVDLSSCLRDLTEVATFARSPRARLAISTYDRTGGNNDWATWQMTGPEMTVELADLKGPGVSRGYG